MAFHFYTDQEIKNILFAYRSLFPEIDSQLAAYWDLGSPPVREWSCLTTNFLTVTPDQVQNFAAKIRESNDRMSAFRPPYSYGAKAFLYREIARKHKVGYSLGICPWTDSLLHETFKQERRSVIIVLGHDWYPIVSDDKSNQLLYPPTKVSQIIDGASPQTRSKYTQAIAPIKNLHCIVLFMNLYPDFREPGPIKVGKIKKPQPSYQSCLDGVAAACRQIRKNYRIECLLSWGSAVWSEARKRLENPRNACASLMGFVSEYEREGRPALLHLDKPTRYYAFAHPSARSNYYSDEITLDNNAQFHASAYKRAVQEICRSLDLNSSTHVRSATYHNQRYPLCHKKM